MLLEYFQGLVLRRRPTKPSLLDIKCKITGVRKINITYITQG